MAWRRPGDKPLSEPMMVRLPTHICVTRPHSDLYCVHLCGRGIIKVSEFESSWAAPLSHRGVQMANMKGRRGIGHLSNIRSILPPQVLLVFTPRSVGGGKKDSNLHILLFWRPDCVLQIAVANYGPVACALHVVQDYMLYSDGVYSSDECGTTTSDINHAVVIVGYGTTDDGIDYWLMLNRSVPWTAQDHAMIWQFCSPNCYFVWETTGHWIALKKDQPCGALMYPLLLVKTSWWINNWVDVNFRDAVTFMWKVKT